MNNDDENHSAPLRLIYDERSRVQEVRSEYWTQAVRNDVTTETQQLLAAVAVEYFDVLYEFRGEAVLDEDDWPDIARLRERIGETEVIHVEAPGRTKAINGKKVPAITQIPPEKIVQMTKDLDDIAKKLGFAADATQVVPEDEADSDDLDELLRGRGQDDVADRLPGGD